MKLKSTLLAATLAMFVAASATAIAAEADVHDSVTAEQGEAKKPVKKHSHAEEKSNMPMPEPKPDMGQHDSMKKMDRHDHTKDKH